MPFLQVNDSNYYNQAHTCKTLGIVTKPKSIASTHAQMRPRNIIHACAITYLRTRDHAQRLSTAGITAAYSFVFAVWGAIKVASLYENYLPPQVLSTG